MGPQSTTSHILINPTTLEQIGAFKIEDSIHTICHEFIATGDVARLKWMLNSKHLSALSYSIIPLWLHAVSTGNVSIAEVIYNTGLIKVNNYGSKGMTALHIAAKNGKREMVEYLIGKLNADTMLWSKYDGGGDGLAGMHYAVVQQDLPLLRTFLTLDPKKVDIMTVYEHRYKTSIHLANTWEVIAILYEFDAFINLVDYDGRTALHHTASKGDIVLAQAIVEKADDEVIKTKDKFGKTALDMVQDETEKEMWERIFNREFVFYELREMVG